MADLIDFAKSEKCIVALCTKRTTRIVVPSVPWNITGPRDNTELKLALYFVTL